MICFYHCDDDGKCAGALVNILGHKDKYNSIFIETNYGVPVPFDKIHKDEYVYIVDFSFDPNDMHKLIEITPNITWIDHHISAISRYEDFPYDVPGIRSVNYSGCMLTYMYLTNQLSLVDTDPKELIKNEKIPYIIKLCDDYDVWRFNLPETKRFHAAFSLIPHGPEEEIWKTFSESDLQELLIQGEAILKYHANQMADIMKEYGYKCDFKGYKCFAINQAFISSDDFDSIDPRKYDILAGYVFDGIKYYYSLRSLEDGPDVSKIAMTYGGGGHPHAAGFTSEFFEL